MTGARFSAFTTMATMQRNVEQPSALPTEPGRWRLDGKSFLSKTTRTAGGVITGRPCRPTTTPGIRSTNAFAHSSFAVRRGTRQYGAGRSSLGRLDSPSKSCSRAGDPGGTLSYVSLGPVCSRIAATNAGSTNGWANPLQFRSTTSTVFAMIIGLITSECFAQTAIAKRKLMGAASASGRCCKIELRRCSIACLFRSRVA